MKINIARLSEMHLVEATYNEHGSFIKYFKEILEILQKYHECSIVTPMKYKNERLFLNSSVLKENKYLNNLEYSPKLDKKLDGEILIIFPPDDLKDSQRLLENGQSYNDLIESYLQNFVGLVFYFDYNNSNFFNEDLKTSQQYKFIHIHNKSGVDSEYDKFINLSALLFTQRIVTKNYNNFYYNLSFMTDSLLPKHNILLNDKIEVVCINNKELLIKQNKNFKILDELGFKDYFKQIINSNAIYINNTEDFLYDERFMLASTYSLPILINKYENKEINIPDNLFLENNIVEKNGKKYINIDNFLINKNNTTLSRELRGNISNYIIKENPKFKIANLIEEEINNF